MFLNEAFLRKETSCPELKRVEALVRPLHLRGKYVDNSADNPEYRDYSTYCIGWQTSNYHLQFTYSPKEKKLIGTIWNPGDEDESDPMPNASTDSYYEGSTWTEYCSSIEELIKLFKEDYLDINESKTFKKKIDKFESKAKKAGKKCRCGHCKDDAEDLDESMDLLRRNGYLIKEGSLGIDLEGRDGSMTAILKKNLVTINGCKSAKAVYDTVASILESEGLDTKATRRLLANIAKKRRLEDAWSVVYNSFLKGADLGVV